MDEQSGCLDLDASTEKYSRACDHLKVNKFASEAEEDFRRLGYALSDMLKQGRAIIEQRSKGKDTVSQMSGKPFQV